MIIRAARSLITWVVVIVSALYLIGLAYELIT